MLLFIVVHVFQLTLNAYWLQHTGQRQRLSTDKPDGSPLLSISEVTNTLLNHE